MHRHNKLLENSQSFFVYCILYFESQNIFPRWVIVVVSYNFVSLSDSLLIFDFLVSSSQELNRLNCLLLTLDNIFIWHRILLKIPLPLIYRPWVRVSVTLRVV
jgi:hypothetical protein